MNVVNIYILEEIDLTYKFLPLRIILILLTDFRDTKIPIFGM